MEHVNKITLIVIALPLLCRPQTRNKVAEEWFSANVISDGGFNPQPIIEIFRADVLNTTLPSTRVSDIQLTTNPIVVTESISTSTPGTTFNDGSLPDLFQPNNIMSMIPLSNEDGANQQLPLTSTQANLNPPIQNQIFISVPQQGQRLFPQFQTSPVQSTSTPITSTSSTSSQKSSTATQSTFLPSTLPPSTNQTQTPTVVTQVPTVQTTISPTGQTSTVITTTQTPSTSTTPVQPQILLQPSSILPQNPSQPQLNPIPIQPFIFYPMQTIISQPGQSPTNLPQAISSQAISTQQIQSNKFLQQLNTSQANLISSIPPFTVINTTSAPAMSYTSSFQTNLPRVSINAADSSSRLQFPFNNLPSITITPRPSLISTTPPNLGIIGRTLKIKVMTPSGSVTNIVFNALNATTQRPNNNRNRRRNRTYDGCIEACGRQKNQILCAAPSGVTSIDPETLKGFPSICHMTCFNSYRNTQYEKIVNGRCGRLRTQIRPINSNSRLKKDQLNRLQYTVVQPSQNTFIEVATLTP